ncbi:hypothetical protein HDV01_001622 [Terramyces sp. JEL0728]|nr:hypothetical protein HDV01_001622 [Terramyces sp. JEL0728]
MKRNLIRRLVIFILLIAITIWLFRRDPVKETAIRTEKAFSEYHRVELKYPPAEAGLEFAFDTELFPSDHIGYMQQNGPEMIKKTYDRQQSHVEIMIDPILKPEFDSIYKDGFCPSSPKCKFSYSDDFKEISRKADTFVTNKREGILVHDAALHFTKTVYLSKREQRQATGRWLRNQKWHGTDIFAYFDRIPVNYPKESFARPMLFPVYKTNITKQMFRQTVDYQKIPHVTMVIEDTYCNEWTNKYEIYKLSKKIAPYLPVKIFPLNCRLGFSSGPLDKICGDNKECFIQRSTSTLLFDTHYDDFFIPEQFWKSISVDTPVMYFWRHSLQQQAPTHFSYHMVSKEIGQSEVEYLLDMSDLEARRFLMKIKKDSKAPEYDKFDQVVDYSLNNFPCRLCEYVGKKKQSVKCMLDLFKRADGSSLQSVNTFLKDKKINGLGVLKGTVDSINIAHYSKSVSRREHVANLLTSMNVEGSFIMGFDKQDIPSEIGECIERGTMSRAGTEKIGGLTPGEISLSVKDFYAIFKILENNLNNTLILEDDVELYEHSDVSEIAKIIKYIPPNYSFVHIGQCLGGVLDGFDQGLKRHGYPRQIKANLGDWRSCGTSFITSKTGAILLFKSLPLTLPIDHQMLAEWTDGNEYGSLKNPSHAVYSVWPPIFAPSERVNMESSTNIRPGQTFKKTKKPKKNK